MSDIYKDLDIDYHSEPEFTTVKDLCNKIDKLIYMCLINNKGNSYVYEIHGLISREFYALRSIPIYINSYQYRKYQVLNITGYKTEDLWINYSRIDEYINWANDDNKIIYSGIPFKISDRWNECELIKALEYMNRKEYAYKALDKLG